MSSFCYRDRDGDGDRLWAAAKRRAKPGIYFGVER